MSKKARTAAPKAASGPAPTPTHRSAPTPAATPAPTTARPPEATPASNPASRPIRKSRMDVDQGVHAAPTRRIKPAAKTSKGVTPAATREAKPTAPSRGKTAPSKGLSALDAAAQVLAGLSKAESREGITAPDLVERMAKAKLWSSPGGKTPAATLYAAMIREITRKGAASRFTRVAPGRFVAGPAGKTKATASARSKEPTPPASTVPSRKPAKSHAEVAA